MSGRRRGLPTPPATGGASQAPPAGHAGTEARLRRQRLEVRPQFVHMIDNFRQDL
jgi:hypothetical protein